MLSLANLGGRSLRVLLALMLVLGMGLGLVGPVPQAQAVDYYPVSVFAYQSQKTLNDKSCGDYARIVSANHVVANGVRVAAVQTLYSAPCNLYFAVTHYYGQQLAPYSVQLRINGALVSHGGFEQSTLWYAGMPVIWDGGLRFVSSSWRVAPGRTVRIQATGYQYRLFYSYGLGGWSSTVSGRGTTANMPVVGA